MPPRTLQDLSTQAALYAFARETYDRGDKVKACWLYHEAEMAETKGSAS